MPQWTIPLHSGGSETSTEIGGKAEGLRELVRRGFDVPRGFCVTADAFRRAVSASLAGADSLEELRERMLRVEFEESLRDEIREEIDRIGAARWAVRSSGLEEDDPRFSFAGQERTELDVEGASEIFEAIRRIWADAFSMESMLYRSRIRVDAVPSAMAVVVQEMVEGEFGGVAFTRDPVASGGEDADENDGREMIVSVSAEDPTAVVEGGSAHHYRVDRAAKSVVEGPEEGPLEGAELEAVVEESLAIEDAAGEPRNIEWVWGRPVGREGPAKLYMLQSRPVTGRSETSDEPSVWTNANVGEALPGVATPLTWSIIGNFSRRGFERAFGSLGLSVPEEYELVGSFRGRVYLNLTQFVSVASGIPILQPDVLFEMAGGGGLELVRDVAGEGSQLEFLKNVPSTLSKILVSQVAMPAALRLWSDYFSARLEKFFGEKSPARTRGALAAELDGIDRLFDRTGRIMLTCSSNFLMSYVVMRKFLEWFGESAGPERERQLFEALEVRSAEPALELLELTERLKNHPEVVEIVSSGDPGEVLAEIEERAEAGSEQARQFLEAFESFRDRHGHRAPREAELSTPRWREESRFIFEVLRAYLEQENLQSSEAYRRGWEEKQTEVDEAVGEIFGPVSGSVFRLILGWARNTARIREFMRAHVIESLDMYREFALECGRRLVDAGLLREVEDVFYLRYEEIRAWLDGGMHERYDPATYPLRVLVRRAVVEKLRDLPDPPNTFVLSDGEMIGAEEYRRRQDGGADRSGTPRDTLEGLPGSRGRVTGRARVIRDPEGASPEESGEILVVPYTDVGWTPMFLTASALVVGLGGPLSHACIVAREFGIPTVVNVQGAADVIENGDNVTVDGTRGIVIVHDEDSEAEAPDRMADHRSAGGTERSSSTDPSEV